MEDHQTTMEETLDPISQKRHQAMLERLSNLHQSRLQQAASRKSECDSSAPAFESTKSFLDKFSESKRSIENELDRCSRNTGLESKDRLKSDLEKISVSIADLEKLVAENSYFLPAYEVRSSMKSISQLKETLDTVNAKLLPKKKFAFKNKPNKKDLNNVVNESEIRVSDEVSVENPSVQVRDSPGFRNSEGVVLVKHFDGATEGDFTLSDLRSCEVRVTGSFRALFIHRLKDCKVFVGPVLGSILIEGVEDCLFMLASHQIRIHYAKKTDFYLRVRSRPIIEDGSDVRFAPYVLCYEGIEKDLRDAGLDEETGNWGNVDDFRWLRAVQSPNWSILPEVERVHTVELIRPDLDGFLDIDLTEKLVAALFFFFDADLGWEDAELWLLFLVFEWRRSPIVCGWIQTCIPLDFELISTST